MSVESEFALDETEQTVIEINTDNHLEEKFILKPDFLNRIYPCRLSSTFELNLAA